MCLFMWQQMTKKNKKNSHHDRMPFSFDSKKWHGKNLNRENRANICDSAMFEKVWFWRKMSIRTFFQSFSYQNFSSEYTCKYLKKLQNFLKSSYSLTIWVNDQNINKGDSKCQIWCHIRAQRSQKHWDWNIWAQNKLENGLYKNFAGG